MKPSPEPSSVVWVLSESSVSMVLATQNPWTSTTARCPMLAHGALHSTLQHQRPCVTDSRCGRCYRPSSIHNSVFTWLCECQPMMAAPNVPCNQLAAIPSTCQSSGLVTE